MVLKKIEDWRIESIDGTSSTQDYARQMSIKNPSTMHCVVIATEHQNSGYGRYGRAWESTEGDLAATIILFCDDVTVQQSLNLLSYITAISVGESILAHDKSLRVQYKWVNDVLLEGRKVSGILLEKTAQNILLIGIGVNIRSNASLNAIHATSLQDYKINIAMPRLLLEILENFKRFYNLWLDFGFQPIKHLWMQHALKHKELISVRMGGADGKVLKGIFEDICEDGALLLTKVEEENADNGKSNDAKSIKIYAAEMFM